MSTAKLLALILGLAVAPGVALAHAHDTSHPPCGLDAGGLGDPAQTQRCLAERFKPPKPKTPVTSAPTSPPADSHPQS